jgi:hypothetical protein
MQRFSAPEALKLFKAFQPFEAYARKHLKEQHLAFKIYGYKRCPRRRARANLGLKANNPVTIHNQV